MPTFLYLDFFVLMVFTRIKAYGMAWQKKRPIINCQIPFNDKNISAQNISVQELELTILPSVTMSVELRSLIQYGTSKNDVEFDIINSHLHVKLILYIFSMNYNRVTRECILYSERISGQRDCHQLTGSSATNWIYRVNLCAGKSQSSNAVLPFTT